MSWLFSQALIEDCASSLSSQEPAAASLGDTCLAGEPCAQLNVMPTPHPFWYRDKTIDASALSRFGLTSRVFTATLGAAVLTSFLAAFPVRTSASPAAETDSTVNAPAFGATSPGSSAKFDPRTSSWRTPQHLLFGEGFELLETLPQWGMTAGGELFPQQMPSGLADLRQSITSENVSGLPVRAPTATAGDAKSSGSRNLPGSKAKAGVSLTDFVKTGDSTTPRRVPTPLESEARQGFQNRSKGMKGTQRSLTTVVLTGETQRVATPIARDWKSGKASAATHAKNSRPLSEQIGGSLNPTWVEWLMGLPLGWTDCAALEMHKFQAWCASHGKS